MADQDQLSGADDFLSDNYVQRRASRARSRRRRLWGWLAGSFVVLLAAVVVVITVVIPATRGPVFDSRTAYGALLRPIELGLTAGSPPATYSGELTAQDMRNEASMFVRDPAESNACIDFRYSEWLLSAEEYAAVGAGAGDSGETEVTTSASNSSFLRFQLTSADERSFGTAARVFSDKSAAEAFLTTVKSTFADCEQMEGAVASSVSIDGVPVPYLATIRPTGSTGAARTVQVLAQRGNAVVIAWMWYRTEPAVDEVQDFVTSAGNALNVAKAG